MDDSKHGFVTWNDSPDIADIDHLSDSDRACLSEIASLLDKFKATDRFGITLLHKHFDMADGEILLEQADPVGRTLLARPVSPPRAGEHNFIETSWRVIDGKVMPVGACATGAYGQHYGYKDD